MSVEQYGARLLADAEEESLADLLKTIKTTVNHQPNDILGFNQVDELLELFRYHQVSIPSRLHTWTSSQHQEANLHSDDVDNEEDTSSRHDDSRRATMKSRPPIIEITSSRSGSGKTTLLYHLTALALLPTTHNGKGSAVVWLDTDNHFSAHRLSQIITSIISKNDPSLSPHAKDSLIFSVLNHLHIIKPTSSTSLITSLRQLPTYLLSPTNPSTTRPLSLLILDSITAFQHQDRLETELTHLSNPSLKSSDQPSRTTSILTTLRTLQAQFECTILFTTTTTHLPPPPPPTTHHPPNNLPSLNPAPAITPSTTPYTLLATLTLHLTRLPIPQYAPSMSLDDCLRDHSKRHDAVSLARVRIGVDVDACESEMWPSGMREKILEMGRKGVFVVRLSADGLGPDGRGDK